MPWLFALPGRQLIQYWICTTRERISTICSTSVLRNLGKCKLICFLRGPQEFLWYHTINPHCNMLSCIHLISFLLNKHQMAYCWQIQYPYNHLLHLNQWGISYLKMWQHLSHLWNQKYSANPYPLQCWIDFSKYIYIYIFSVAHSIIL